MPDQPAPTAAALATCECAVPQIKPAWDGKGRLVCEDCYGQIARASKMSGQNARPGGPANEANRLLEYALHLRMYGENAPGGTETWAEWDRMAEGFLRDQLCAERGHAPEGRCCPSWFKEAEKSA